MRYYLLKARDLTGTCVLGGYTFWYSTAGGRAGFASGVALANPMRMTRVTVPIEEVSLAPCADAEAWEELDWSLATLVYRTTPRHDLPWRDGAWVTPAREAYYMPTWALDSWAQWRLRGQDLSAVESTAALVASGWVKVPQLAVLPDWVERAFAE